MRTFTDNYAAALGAPNKEPRYVIEFAFDTAGTDLVYFTSHPDIDLPAGAARVDGVIGNISDTSQKIDPVGGTASIGSFGFTLVDYNNTVSAVLNTKDASGIGLRHKRVRAYYTYADLAWADYGSDPITTQIIVDYKTKGANYEFSCKDIQRTEKTKIFVLESTTLRETITAGATMIPVDNDPFTAVAHGTSYTDAPSSEVFYVQIEDERIRCTGSHTDGSLGLVLDVDTGGRGVLNTRAVEHIVDTSASQDRRPEVKEYVYLEMPTLKLIYALMTGVLYNQSGKTLPSSWNVGMSTSYVRTADYITRHPDLYDAADDTFGHISRIEGLENEDAKKFIEQKLCLMLGLYRPVYGNGELGLRRAASIGEDASHVAVINETNTVKKTPLKFLPEEIINQIELLWNWDPDKEKFTRKNILIDTTSIAKHGAAPLKVIELPALHGSIHSYDTLKFQFDTIRERSAGEPIEMQITCLPSLAYLEVGDVARVQLQNVRDHKKATTYDLDRAMEVQQRKFDWKSGRVTFTLKGSTEPAGPLADFTATTVLNDTWYTSVGTDITTLPGVSLAAGIVYISGNPTFNGSTSMDAAASQLYSNYPIVGQDGASLTITGNVHLRIKGTLTPQGSFSINGVGGGRTDDGGWFGTSMAGGGIERRALFLLADTMSSTKGTVRATDNQLPPLNMVNSSGTLVVPTLDLRGGAGGAGGNVTSRNIYGIIIETAAGGAGGNGGAGLMITCRGMDDFVSGSIDLSGDDGSLGASGTSFGTYNAGSGGGGRPGVFVLNLDGSAANVPNINALTLVTKTGSAPVNGFSLPGPEKSGSSDEDHPIYSYYTHGDQHTPDYIPVNHVAWRVIYIQPYIAPEADVNTISDPVTITAANVVYNTPPTLQGDQATIEVTISPPPSDGSWHHGNFYYRVKDSGDGWVLFDSEITEGVVQVTADGTTFEIGVRSVSISDIESPEIITTEVTLNNLVNPDVIDTPPESSVLVPNVTGLELEGQGNGSEFTGKDIKTQWNHVAGMSAVAIGSEADGLGAGQGSQDSYFKDYQVSFYKTDGAHVHTGYTTDNFYRFTHELNAEAYERIEGTVGAYRSLDVKVWARTNTNRISAIPAKIYVTNPAPELAGVSILSGLQMAQVAWNRPTDLDFLGVRLYLSTSSGFTPSAATLVQDTNESPARITKLTTGTTYYLIAIPYDAFGDGTATTELSFITDSFIPESATEIIDGLLKVVSGSYNLYVGSHSVGGSAALLSSNNSTYYPFVLYEDGSARLGGIGGDTILIDGGNKRLTIGSETYGSTGFQFEYNSGSPRAYIGNSLGSLEITSSILKFKSATANSILIDGANKRLTIGNETWQGIGLQFEYNGGTPRGFIGNYSNEKYIEFDGTDINIGRETELKGADAYNNSAIYYHSWCDDLATSSGGAGSSGIAAAKEYAFISMPSGAALGDNATVYRRPLYQLSTFTWAKSRRFKTKIRFNGFNTNKFIKILTGTINTGFGFYVDGSNKLYGISTDPSTVSATVDLGITIPTTSTEYELEAIFTAGSKVEFYVDNIYKGQITTNLPTTSDTSSTPFVVYMYIYATAATSNQIYAYMSEWKLLQEK